MFGPFASEEKKMRANAKNWLELAHKVYDFRRDQLSHAVSAELKGQIVGLEQTLKEREGAAKVKLRIEALEEVLRRTGGTLYPRSTMQEYVEFFLVAALVILGIRTYFVQPFKIPTNSMWPSYYGMMHEVFPNVADEPSPLARVGRFLVFGASHYRVEAPASGEVQLLIFGNGLPAFSEKSGRKWVLFPTILHEYRFRVGGEVQTVSVPADFDFERMLRQAFLGTSERSISDAALERDHQHKIESSDIVIRAKGGSLRTAWLPLGKNVNLGEAIICFDILTGDQLFVDRFSYHFIRPRVGQGFVFRTDHIKDISGPPQYYIKRLVGSPGDKIEIRDPGLFRNGKPISGAAAFDKNAKREGKYRGYHNGGLLALGEEAEVPSSGYLALGDNSGNSLDGRFWGYVPKKDVVGRPLFIYYPLTRRWGPAP